MAASPRITQVPTCPSCSWHPPDMLWLVRACTCLPQFLHWRNSSLARSMVLCNTDSFTWCQGATAGVRHSPSLSFSASCQWSEALTIRLTGIRPRPRRGIVLSEKVWHILMSGISNSILVLPYRKCWLKFLSKHNRCWCSLSSDCLLYFFDSLFLNFQGRTYWYQCGTGSVSWFGMALGHWRKKRGK